MSQSPDAELGRLDRAGRKALGVRTDDVFVRTRKDPKTGKTIPAHYRKNTISYGAASEFGGDFSKTPKELGGNTDEHDPAGHDFYRMADIGKTNINHFFPLNQSEYAKHHDLARKAAAKKDRKEALLQEGFAAHFLQDSFAAGHMAPRALDTTAEQLLPAAADREGRTTAELGLHRTKNWHDALNTVQGDGLPLIGAGGVRFHGDDTLTSGELEYIGKQAANSLGQVLQILGVKGAKAGPVKLPAGPDVNAIMGFADADPYKVIWKAMQQDYAKDLADARGSSKELKTDGGVETRHHEVGDKIFKGIYGAKMPGSKVRVQATEWSGDLLMYQAWLGKVKAPAGTKIWIRWFDKDLGIDRNEAGRPTGTVTAGTGGGIGDGDTLLATTRHVVTAAGLGSIKAPVDKSGEVYAVFYSALNDKTFPGDEKNETGAHRQVDWTVPVGRSGVQGKAKGTVDRGLSARGFAWNKNTLRFRVTDTKGKAAGGREVYVRWFDQDSGSDRDAKGDLAQTVVDRDDATGATAVKTKASGGGEVTATGVTSNPGDTYAVVYRDAAMTIPIGRSGVQKSD